MNKLCGGYAEENQAVLETLNGFTPDLECSDLDTSDIGDAIERIALHVDELRLTKHDEDMQSIGIKAQITQLSHNLKLCEDQIAQETDHMNKETITEQKLEENISNLKQIKGELITSQSTVLQQMEIQKVKLTEMRNLQERTEIENGDMHQRLLELQSNLEMVKKETIDQVESMSAENDDITEKNTKLKIDINQISMKYQKQIQSYFNDMDQNKRFIALLRDKIKALQEESNNFGDAGRTKPKKSSKQQRRPRTPR